ncbi:hypothetical protein E4U26_005682, partial [Claviceps purpurea]
MNPSVSAEQRRDSNVSIASTKRASDSTDSSHPAQRLLTPTRPVSPPASQPGGDTRDGPILFIDGLTPQDSSPSTIPQDNPPTPDEQRQRSPIIETHTSRLPYRSTRGQYRDNTIQRYGQSLIIVAVGALMLVSEATITEPRGQKPEGNPKRRSPLETLVQRHEN